MQSTGEKVINVQELEPRLRHQTIFQTFEDLNEGESLVIHNNHDPKPVYYQMMEMYGEVFSWEYLEEGPEWWDIKVTKISNAPSMLSSDNDIVLNVTELHPSVKHQTIFDTFDKLKPGEGMVIHNDHDPMPLFYQLKNMHGDTFSWTYLKDGPDWWDIRIAKEENEADGMPEDAVYKNVHNDYVINVPKLEPKEKHPTIFKVFENLKEGESMIIHNDHDPKPLYYQLLNDHGEIFSWQYLEEGPKWWDIKVTIQGIDNSETIGDITRKDWRKAEVFKKYGIDFCCGGNKTVKQACDEKGIDFKQVENDLQQAASSGGGGYTNYDEWNLDFLADYIQNTHHNYVRKNMPEIRNYAAKVFKVHGAHHPELGPIQQLVEQVNEELMEHMEEEEGILFPWVKRILKAKNENSKYEQQGDQTFEQILDKSVTEHQSVGDAVDRIRELANEFTLPEDACASYTLLYKMLDDFENDLHTHIHLENNILFPKAAEMEKQLV